MNPRVANRILDAALGMGLDVVLRDNYSGRGMAGETTAALILGCPLMHFVAAVAMAATIPGEWAEVEGLIEEVGKARVDSLGRQTIVY